jgi:hypothetical protein
MCDKDIKRMWTWTMEMTGLFQHLRFNNKRAVSKAGWEIDMTRARLPWPCANPMLSRPILHFTLITTPFRLNRAASLSLIVEVP